MNKKEEIKLLQIPNLFLRSKLILRGYFSGIHPVPYKGSSSEFSQYREYVAGDDFNRIDWKAYLKSSKYYVKESDDETNAEMVLLLDTSASMGFFYKFEYSKTLAFLFSYICAKQNDSFSYGLFSDKLHVFKRAGAGKKSIYEACRDINSSSVSGETKMIPALEKVFEKTKEPSFIVLITDMGDDENEIIDSMAGMRVKKNDAIIFHISSRKEESRDILDNDSLMDMETKLSSVGGRYAERLKIIKERNKRIRENCLMKSIDYNAIYIEDGFDDPLSVFFRRRLS
ncbi:MAG: DUF58 domain-containing protein [bacterium]|nr:DUF58 domain-containing protein [bacterium]